MWEAIRLAAPKKLYIASDGPKHGEEELCKEVQKITLKIDWPCEVKRLNRTENLGCGKAVSEAISWFFEQEEQGVILEDDTLPHPDFFRFCDEMLQKHQSNENILMVSGNNKTGYAENGCSYSTINLSNIWGWATWRRAWQNFDYEMKSWKELKHDLYLSEASGDVYKHKLSQYQQTFDGKIDSWGYRWECAVLARKGKCIIPNRNLIENIGFGPGAAHTLAPIPGIYNTVNLGLDFPLIHPQCK